MTRINTQLQFGPILNLVKSVFKGIPDHRKANLVDYKLDEVATAGLAMMFFQDASLLAFQERLKAVRGSHNLKTLFGVEEIPSATQMRSLLDTIDPEALLKVFRELISQIQLTNIWRDYKCLDGRVPLLLDGTEYFNSKKLHCDSCLIREKSNGKEYYHQALVGSFVSPKLKQVLPAFIEAIAKEDGSTKNDCEINAAKRFISKFSKHYCHLNLVIVADSLYSKSPFIETVLANKSDYIFVAKQGDHKNLQEEIRALRSSGDLVTIEFYEDGQKHTLEYLRDIQVFDNSKLTSNWVSYTVTRKKGSPFHCEWLTSIKPTKKNVREIAETGRMRWKIENDVFNALKNEGSNLEHNFGHGKKHLQFNFFLLNIIAFLFHQILALSDVVYLNALTYPKTYCAFFEKVKFLTREVLWDDWLSLMEYCCQRDAELIVIRPGK